MRDSPAVRAALLRGLSGLLAVASGVGCSDSTAGDLEEGAAAVVARPELPPSLSTAAFALDVDRVRLLLVRQPSELMLDTTVFFPADSTQLTVRLKVLLAQPRDQLTLAMELRSGKQLLFSGSSGFEAIEGSNVAPVVPLQYVGPGNDLTTLVIEPRDSVLKPGDIFTFSVRAFQGRIPVDLFYAGWASSDPRVSPVDAKGTLKAPAQRGSVFLRVVSPTGVKDSTRVWFSPPPSAIERLSGDGQQGAVGDPLPQPLAVRVTAADGLGVPGVRVRFLAPFGSRVQDTLVITDSEGVGRTIASLGPVPTLYTFEAQIPFQPAVTFQTIGLPGPPVAIAKQAGDWQTAPAGQLLLPFAVRVEDRFGNGIGDAEVTWEVVTGGGALSASVSTTDPTGRTSVTYRLGPLPGINAVRARLANGESVVFASTGTP